MILRDRIDVEATFRHYSRRGGTRSVHDIDFTHSGLPRGLKMFMKAIDVVGSKAGKLSLDGIMELVERAQAWSPIEQWIWSEWIRIDV